MQETIVPVVLFAALALIFWKFYDTRHKENMAMIERGISVGPKKPEQYAPSVRYLSAGLIVCFTAVGLIAGLIVHPMLLLGDAFTLGLMILGAGLGLMASYGVRSEDEKRREKKDMESRDSLVDPSFPKIVKRQTAENEY